MGELKDSQWKYERAAEICRRRQEDKPDPLYPAQQRGNAPMYHAGFYYYIRWILGALPPLQDAPMYWTEEEGESYHDHVRYFGRPKEIYEVVAFLIELFDRTFYQLFGCRADLEDYRYVAEIVARASSKLEIVPASMSTATSWLNEQIEWMQAARLKASVLSEQAALNADLESYGNTGLHSSHEILTTTHVSATDCIDAEQAPTSDPWEGLFRNYTLTKLNNLLVLVGLLDTASPPTIAEYTRPGQWVAVIAALIKAKRISTNRAAVGRAFYETYGDESASLSSYQKQYNEGNEAFNKIYNSTLLYLTQD
jgi:hypothetical protein